MRHHSSDPAYRRFCARRLEAKLHGFKWRDRRQHDRSSRARLRFKHRWLQRSGRWLCHGLSSYDTVAHSFSAGSCDRAFPMNAHTLGEPRIVSNLSHTISDEVRIPERIEIGAEPGLQFELAGPRAKLFFEATKTRAGIVTCGGLCPGLNNVIRSLFLELY